MKSTLCFYLFLTISFLSHLSASTFERAIDYNADFVSKSVRSIANHTYRDTAHAIMDYEDVPKTSFSIQEINKGLYLKYHFNSTVSLPVIGKKIDTIGSIYRHRNTIIVAFHGSTWLDDWIQNARFLLKDQDYLPQGQVHGGFKSLIDGSFDQMIETMKMVLKPDNLDLLESYINLNQHYLPYRDDILQNWDWKNDHLEFIFTGHSLGGALAILAASRFSWFSQNDYDDLGCSLLASNISFSNQIKVFTFSAPRIGDRTLINNIHTRIPPYNILRFHCQHDIVPQVPLKKMGYEDVGWPIEILTIEHVNDKIKVGAQYLSNGNGVDHRKDVLSRMMLLGSGILKGGVMLVTAYSALPALTLKSFLALKTIKEPVGELMVLFHEVPTRESVFRALSQTQIEENLREEIDMQEGPGKVSFWSVNRNPLMAWIDSFF